MEETNEPSSQRLDRSEICIGGGLGFVFGITLVGAVDMSVEGPIADRSMARHIDSATASFEQAANELRAAHQEVAATDLDQVAVVLQSSRPEVHSKVADAELAGSGLLAAALCIGAMKASKMLAARREARANPAVLRRAARSLWDAYVNRPSIVGSIFDVDRRH